MFLPIGDDVKRNNLPIIPIVLIVANVFVYILQVQFEVEHRESISDITEMYSTWALVPQEFLNGRVIGLLSYMFMHGGLLHLVGNMIVLWAFACTLEVAIGRLHLVGFFVLWGVVGGLLHVFMHSGSDIPLVGASGAIAGLIGAYTVAFGPAAKIKCLFFLFFAPFRVNIPAWIFGLGWIMLQLSEAADDVDGSAGVAWFCHIGGFAAGALTMLLFRHENEGELVQSSDGKYELRTQAEIEAAAEAAARLAEIEGPLSQPQYGPWDGNTFQQAVTDLDLKEQVHRVTCVYCDAELLKSDFISPLIAKCASCQRLTYLEKDDPRVEV